MPARCCGSPPTSAPRPSGGSALRSAATTTARTPWQISWRTASRPASSTSPTAASSPCTAGSGSPAPALTWPGGSRTARNPSRSRPSQPCPTALSWSCCTNQTACAPGAGRKQATRAERLPDTAARLVTFTVTTRTRSGRAKTTEMRVLTTLLDHQACPAREIAVLYAERWQIEIAFLHLKKTVRGPRRPLRGQSPELARQEARALLLIHNIVATATARAAGSASLDPGLIPFTAVLGLVRSHVAADTCCRHCGHRPASADAPLASLDAAILALPRHRQGRQRTSGRTAAERRTRHTEEVTYTIDITKSNLPKWDTTPET